MSPLPTDLVTSALGVIRVRLLFVALSAVLLSPPVVAGDAPAVVGRSPAAASGPGADVGERVTRLQERTANRDKDISVSADVAQLQALSAWGQKRPADLSAIKQPVLGANGDADRRVPTTNSHDLAQRLPNSELVIYADAGHGGIFQYHADFVSMALDFLGDEA